MQNLYDGGIVKGSLNYVGELDGWLGVDAYSTAWAALVPDLHDPGAPAWPHALAYLHATQLADGGWGDPCIYYAHERTISTLVAILALHTWKFSGYERRIQRALKVIHRYAEDMPKEAHEPIGFELLLPRLIDELLPLFPTELPLEHWASVETASQEKLARIRHLCPDPTAPNTWWVSMEMLPEKQLAEFDDQLLDPYGSIATSTAATAAYLRARRRAGHNSLRASHYLDSLLKRGNGGVPFCWPAEVFDRLWSLDSFRRAGFDPETPFLARLIKQTRSSWNLKGSGISYSDDFPISDSDHTLVGFTVLNWAGWTPSDESLLAFWDHDHFLTYLDERNASISVNVHGLTALRSQPSFPHRELAIRLTEWLAAQMKPNSVFIDKWHLSPFYPVSRAIPAFVGWNDSLALHCITFLIEHQRPDGGWGWFSHSTQEETALCVLALVHAQRHGMLEQDTLLTRAGAFLDSYINQQATERLWIGKTLYRPGGIVKAMVHAARYALAQLGLNILALEQVSKPA